MNGMGFRLRLARERKKLKQTQVKEKLGINNKTLSGYENEVSEPDGDTLKMLSELYEVSIDWLYGVEVTNNNKNNLSDSQIERVIKETEEKYNVNLHDDPVVLGAMTQLIESLARMKSDR